MYVRKQLEATVAVLKPLQTNIPLVNAALVLRGLAGKLPEDAIRKETDAGRQ